MSIVVVSVVALLLGVLIGWIARGNRDRPPGQAGEVTEVDGVSLATVTDPMTGLFNRQGYRLLAARLLREATRERHPAALMLFDIDGLSAINERLGQTAGDEAITSATTLCSNSKTLYQSVCSGGCGGVAYVGVFDYPGTWHEACLRRADEP